MLLFDLGGVLVENVGFERLAALLAEPTAPIALKARWLASPAVQAFETGRLDDDAFALAFVDEWSLACSPQAFLREFAAWPKGFHAGAVDLLARLRTRYRVACLSNSNALHWRRFDEVRAQFDPSLSSHLLGVAKPDRVCFEHAVAACGVAAARIVFFDDAPANVDAARAVGLRAFLVDGLAGVERVVEAEGLLA